EADHEAGGRPARRRPLGRRRRWDVPRETRAVSRASGLVARSPWGTGPDASSGSSEPVAKPGTICRTIDSAATWVESARSKRARIGGDMGKLDGRVAVITAATSGMALATAKLFVEQGAYVFITGRRQKQLDDAVKAIGRNVTGVQGDAGNLADLDRLYGVVKREKGRIDVLFASAGYGEMAPIGEVTEEHFDKTFDLNVRGTLFTVQKALPLVVDGGSIIMNGSIASVKGFPA